MKKISLNYNFINKVKKVLFPFYRSKEIKKIFDILEKGKTDDKKIAMFVGGCVRNYILNDVIDDIDIATILSPKEIIEKFKNTDIRVVETGIDHGSVTLLVNKLKFEITTLRKDVKTDGRHAEISFTDDWQEDSNRRDFTINAIYLDRNGNFYDPQLGIKDLKNNIVKFIGDPSKRINEDYLRIIRFIRFSIQYDHNTLESSTINAIKMNLSGINKLSKERVLKELLKILSLKSFLNILKNENLKDIFTIIFPEFKNLDRMKKFTMLSKKDLSKVDSTVILALNLIDGSNNYEYFCHKYKTSNLIKNNLETLAKSFKEYKSDKNYLKKNLKKNIYFLGKEVLKNLALLIFFENKQLKYKDLIAIYKNIEKISVPKFPYSGEYLKGRGFTEGKKIGHALKELEKVWVENNYSLSEENIITILKKIRN